MLQEASSVNGSSTGHDKDAAVDRVGSPELPIVTLEIVTGDEIDNREPVPLTWSCSQSLFSGGHDTHTGVLKGSQDGRNEIDTPPENVIIGEDCDGSVDNV
jgi:hypothetical protein